MKHKNVAAILALLGAVCLWQAFAQTETPCVAACKAKRDECMKEAAKEEAGIAVWLRLGCQANYEDCVKACK
jgi:hypothetical protein